MKTPPFLLIGCPIIIVVAALTYAMTHPTLREQAFHSALMDAQKIPGETSSTNTAGTDERAQRMQHAFDQLDLTDAQKQQISQIRQTTTDHKARREAIMNILTPEQKTKWEQIRAARRNGEAAPPTTTNGT